MTALDEMNEIIVMGLMAGTSVDGIDAALIRTDGRTVRRTGHALTTSYDPETRKAIFRAFETPQEDHDDLPEMIARDHARAAEMLIAESQIMPDLIGFHGQTIYHAPQDGISMQIGDAKYLARRLGVPVMHQFRQNDLAQGGQGAPLAPIYHAALMNAMGLSLPAAVVNIGGISNASIVTMPMDIEQSDDDFEHLIGLDLGPGNALMDDLAMRAFNQHFDKDGAYAAEGQCDEACIEAVMDHEFFKRPGPKSLDRKGLYALIDSARLDGLAPADQMATLAAMTAASIIKGITLNCPEIKTVIICGGGGLNPSLMATLRSRAGTITVSRMEDYMIGGQPLDSRFIEAELMGFLAVRSQYGLPITFPHTTGVMSPQTGGVLVSASI